MQSGCFGCTHNLQVDLIRFPDEFDNGIRERGVKDDCKGLGLSN